MLAGGGDQSPERKRRVPGRRAPTGNATPAANPALALRALLAGSHPVRRGGGARFALAVASVESTEHLEPASETEIQTGMTQQCRELVRGVAKRKRGQQMVLLLNTDSNLLS